MVKQLLVFLHSDWWQQNRQLLEPKKDLLSPQAVSHTGSVVPRAPCRVELRPCAGAASDSANGKWRGSAGSANAFHLHGLLGQLDRRRMSEVGKAGPKEKKGTKKNSTGNTLDENFLKRTHKALQTHSTSAGYSVGQLDRRRISAADPISSKRTHRKELKFLPAIIVNSRKITILTNILQQVFLKQRGFGPWQYYLSDFFGLQMFVGPIRKPPTPGIFILLLLSFLLHLCLLLLSQKSDFPPCRPCH